MSAARPEGARVEDALDALRDALGHEAVQGCDREVDGVRPAGLVRPADGAALARALGLLGERGLAAIPCGGGSRLALGNPPERADVLLSTARLSGIEHFEPSEGVVRARAGTRLAALREAVRAAGWELPLDAPGRDATVGGVLAAAAFGPRRLGFGAPRDTVLGLDVVLASGERTRCGGRVVKNVTGYDLAKLYVGSLGTLGVIEAAWLRLRPVPEAVSVLCGQLSSAAEGLGAGLAAARLGTARAAALVDGAAAARAGLATSGSGAPGEGRWTLVVELAGDAAAVERDAASLGERASLAPADAEAVERLCAWHGGEPALRARIDVLPSALERTCAVLADALGQGGDRGDGWELVVHPGLGLVYAACEAGGEEPSGLAASLEAVAKAASAGGGATLLERLPTAAKRGRDVFGDAGAALPLMRALKQRFDPRRVLSPGRFVGSL